MVLSSINNNMMQVGLPNRCYKCSNSRVERLLHQCTTSPGRISRRVSNVSHPIRRIGCSGSATGPLAQEGRDGDTANQPSVSEDVGTVGGLENEVVGPEKPTLWKRFKTVFLGGGLDKAKIKALGIGAVLSYGFISNVSYGACVAVAWITHVKRSGLSPLAAGQWSGFLAVYAGLWALQNFLRPMRFALAVALTPAVNSLMEHIMESWGWSKGQAFGFLMLVMGVGTMAILGGVLWILGGFPPTPSTA